MITKNCKYCGSEFRARGWKSQPGIFCSRQCSYKGREVKLKKFECLNCKNNCVRPLSWKSPAKYCSTKCSAIGRKRVKGKKYKTKEEKERK